MNEIINFRGERSVWKKFAIKAKIKGEQIWNILKPFIKKYSNSK